MLLYLGVFWAWFWDWDPRHFDTPPLDAPNANAKGARIDKLGRGGIRVRAKEVRPPATHQWPLFEMEGECDFSGSP